MTDDEDMRRDDSASPGVALRPERLFIGVGAVFGLIFALFTPPFDTPDELRHFGRVYLIAEGRLGVPGFAPGHGSTLPEDLRTLHALRTPEPCQHSVAELVEHYAEPRRPAPRRKATRIATPFPPLVYAPSALGVGLGRLFDAPAIALLHLARLFNLIAWLALGWWAIRRAGARRWLLAGLGLLPTSLFLASSVTADAGTLALAMAFFAAVTRAATASSAPLDAREVRIVLGLAFALGMTKPGYGILALGVALIPPARLGGRSGWAGLLAAAFAMANGPALAWALYAQSVQPAALGPAADPVAQLLGVLASPFDFMGVLISTTLHEALPWLAGFVGLLGTANVPLPLWMYAAYPILLIAACGLDTQDDPARPPPDARRRIAAAGLAILTAIAVITLGYVGWNPVGADLVADIHGRYFLPLAPFLALALPRFRLADPRARIGVAAGSVLGLIVAVGVLVRRYYGGGEGRRRRRRPLQQNPEPADPEPGRWPEEWAWLDVSRRAWPERPLSPVGPHTRGRMFTNRAKEQFPGHL